MRIKLRKEYLEVWLKRLAAVDMGAGLHAICKSVYMKLEDNKLILVRSANNRSFAVIRTDEIEEIEDTNNPLEALVPCDQFHSIVRNFSNGSLRIETTAMNGIVFKQNGYKGIWKQKYGKEGFHSDKAFVLISDMLGSKSDSLIKVEADQFIKAVKKIKYAPLKSSYNPGLKNVVFKDERCWALNHSRYHERELVGLSELDFVLPYEALALADFIYHSGESEFSYCTDDQYYFFIVGEDFFILEKNEIIA